MIPILYDKTGKVKLGELVDIIDSGYVEGERNGIFELSFDYPNNYPLSDLLVEENMIEVKPNDEQDLQKFRIYDTKCFMKNIITVFVRHESFDLANDHAENVNLENASCEYALNTLFRNSHFSTHYRGYSDIINAQNYKIDNVNILNAIAGKEGSIIDTYGTGAEILRDGTNIHVLNKRGHDNDVTIEFGKNLTDFVLERDLTDLETRVGGLAKYTDENNKEVIVKSNWIDSPYIDNFAHPYISVEGRRDYSDKFKDGEIPTVEKLGKLCADEFKINKRDIPKSNYTIKFIPLSKCVGHEGIQDKISLCDTVRIIDKRFNVDTKAKVIKYKYDFVKERYESMELGEPRTTLGDIIGGVSGEVGPPGKDGADGNIEDFPDTLPNVPTLTANVKGWSSIDLSWTFENKVYYNYELYASKTKDFKPNVFDLIHEGQSSSHLFQAKPEETWYFKVCAKNTHGSRTEFSPQVTVTTKKSDDFEEYFSTLGVGNLVANIFSTDYMEAGIIKGNWIDMRHLTLTDGNGKRVFDVDDFGKMYADINTLKIKGEDISSVYANRTELNQTANQLELKATSIQNNMLNNSNGFDDKAWWGISNANMSVRTPVTNPEIKRGFHFVNGTNIGIRFSQELNLQGGKTYTFQLNCTDIQINTLNGYRVTVQDNADGSLVYNSGNITSTGIRRFKYTPNKTGSFKLGIWHNGASQVNGSVIAFEDYLFLDGDFNYQLTWVDNVNDTASISVKANQIVNKVSASDVTSIIEQNPSSVEVSFNKINSNVSNDSSAFRVRNGAIEVYNPQGLKCFSVDPDGWLRVWGLKVYGPQNPIQFTGNGDKGIEINANKGNANYIDFSDNGSDQDYVCRIIRYANANMLSLVGGAEIKNSPTNPTARLELRSDVGGDAYIDFAHNPSEDYQVRLIHGNRSGDLRLEGAGLMLTGNDAKIRVDRIGRATNLTASLYVDNNIDMGGRVIYNSNIVTPAVYSTPRFFSFAVIPTQNNVSDVLDNIKFNETVDSDNIVGLEMDLSNVLDTSFVVMDEEANAYGDMQNLLKLALKEIQELKREVRELKR